MYQVLCTAVRMIDLKVSRTSYVDIRTPFGTLCSHHVMNSIMRERLRDSERDKKKRTPIPGMGVFHAYTQFVLSTLYSTPQHLEPAQSTPNQR